MANIYKVVKGVKTKVSASEVKQTIMKANNWTSEQYRKQYDLFKNKLRAFESYEEGHGKAVKPQSPVEVLYKQAKAKIREGADYKPSIAMQRIQSFSAVSITKGRSYYKKDKDKVDTREAKKRAKRKVYDTQRTSTYYGATYRRFEGLIKKNEGALRIFLEIDDPVKLEEALVDYANKMHINVDNLNKLTSWAIPFSGESYGSTEEIAFDLTPYL